jgi:hypothetical protein
MKPRQYLILFILGFLVILVTASFQAWPGYMDADYYYANGARLAGGDGFTEPFLWNYLDDPQGIPHPAFAYWMPLASFIAFASMKVSGITGFNAARGGFMLLGAFIPPLTAALAYSFTQNQRDGILAGILAAISGFYLPFFATSDTFTPYMLLGGLFFLILTWDYQKASLRRSLLVPFLLGLIAGLMHLARTEGILWILLAFGGLYWSSRSDINPDPSYHETGRESGGGVIIGFRGSTRFGLVILGYLIVMGPWMVRNFLVFGTPLSPGGSRVLWLTHYDELFAYPASILNPANWWSSGIAEILRARLDALGQNLQTILAVQGEIFLFPLMVVGAWQRRHDLRLRVALLALILTLLVMTVVFPFAGSRGGLFHAGAAWQPLFWALVPVGFESFLSWGGRVRGWHREQARKIFSIGIVGLALLLTGLIAQKQLFGGSFPQSAWDRVEIAYQNLEADLRAAGIGSQEIVLVNNPPGYYVATGRSAIYTPFGDQQNLIAAAQRYGAHFLLLEKDHPEGLNDLYNHPGDRPGLDYLFTSQEIHVFEVVGLK